MFFPSGTIDARDANSSLGMRHRRGARRDFSSGNRTQLRASMCFFSPSVIFQENHISYCAISLSVHETRKGIFLTSKGTPMICDLTLQSTR